MVRKLEEEKKESEKRTRAMSEILEQSGLQIWLLLWNTWDEEKLEESAAKRQLHPVFKSNEAEETDAKRMILAKAIAKDILDPENLHQTLYTLSAEKLAVLEKAASYWSAWYEAENETEALYLKRMSRGLAEFVVADRDDKRAFRICSDACAALHRTMTDKFRKERALVLYVYLCTGTLEDFYGFMPLHEFGNFVRGNKKLMNPSDSEIRNALNKIPKYYCCFTIRNGNIIAGSYADAEHLAMLRMYQRDLPFYFLTPEEINELILFDYPKSDPIPGRMRTFLKEKMALPEEETDQIAWEAWKHAIEKLK